MDKEEVKTCIRALLNSTASSVRLNSLLYDFKKMSGVDMPLFEYKSPLEFLLSLKDTVQLFQDSSNPEVCLVNSEKSAHITSLVDRQRFKIPPRFSCSQRRVVLPCNEVHIDSPVENDHFQIPKNTSTTKEWVEKTSELRLPSLMDIEIFPQEIMSNLNGKNSGEHTPFQDMFNENDLIKLGIIPDLEKIQEDEMNFYKTEKTDNCYLDNFGSCYSTGEDSISDKIFSSVNDELYLYVNDGMKNKLKNLIKEYPKGLWCCDLPNLFQEKYNLVLDYREFGYTSLIKMLSELPDIFRCIRPGMDDWILFDASLPPSPEEMKMINLQILNGDKGCEIKKNLKKLLLNNSACSGVELDQILNLYEKMFGSKLDYCSLGFDSLKSLLSTLEGNLLTMYEINGKCIVMPTLETSAHSPVKWEKALPPITAENDIFYEIFPQDVVGPDEKFFEFDLSRHVEVGKKVEVCVAEVWSPTKFYIQLYKYKDHLSKLMKDLQDFYNVYLTKYKMPEATIRPKQVCVALYSCDSECPEEWHRAQIIKVVNEKTVSVNLVDYGTVTRIKKNQLRFLHRNFHSFPIQAFRAKLAGIEPLNGNKWSVPVSKRFLELLQVPYLEARMVEVNFDKSSMSVVLYDKLQHTYKNINRNLVIEKMARFTVNNKENLSSGSKEEKTKENEKNITPVNSLKQHDCSNVSVKHEENLLGVSDEFLEINDLEKDSSAVLLFTTNQQNSFTSANVTSSKEATNKDSGVTYEFDEVPELNVFEFNEKVKEDNEQVKEDVADVEYHLSESVSLSNVNFGDKSPEDPSNFIQVPSEIESSTPKPNKSPPGIQSSSDRLDFNQCLSLGVEQSDRKNINLLAIELFSKNSAIKEVALMNPELALKIAIEMAETYLSSLHFSMCNPLSRASPLDNCYDLSSQSTIIYGGGVSDISANFAEKTLTDLQKSLKLKGEINVASQKCSKVDDETQTTFPEKYSECNNETEISHSEKSSKSSEDSHPEKSSEGSNEIQAAHSQKSEEDCGEITTLTKTKPENSSAHPSAEVPVHVTKKTIGGKNIHLLKMNDGQCYFCADEVLEAFTIFYNREFADKVLQGKRIRFEYKILSKKSDEAVLKILKSCDIPSIFKKKKKKKLQVHLIKSCQVLTYLEALGCLNNSNILDFQDLINIQEKQTLGKRSKV